MKTEIEKLEIQHIAPYLPFGLKAHDEEYGETFFVCSYRQDSDEWLIHDNIDGSVIEYSRDVLKPILRPLSDLTKEITRNGETFVPIVELYKIARGRYEDSIVRYWEKMSSKSIKIEMEGHNNYIFSLVFSDCDVRLESGLNFQLYSTDLHNDNPKNVMIQCWNVLFQKLYEWHFDVFGLIEKGLAIDINTFESCKKL